MFALGARYLTDSRIPTTPSASDHARGFAYYRAASADLAANFAAPRTISAQLGRPMAIQDDEIDLKLPLDVSDAELTEWGLTGSAPTLSPSQPRPEPIPITGFLCFLRIMRINQRTHRVMFGERVAETDMTSAVSELDSLLNEWHASIPEHLRWNRTSQDPKWASSRTLLATSFYFAQTFVHRELIKPPLLVVGSSIPSLAICSNAARSSAHILDSAREAGVLVDLFWIAPYFATTSVIMLSILLVRQGQRDGTANARSPAALDAGLCLAAVESLCGSTFIACRMWGVGNALVGTALRYNERIAAEKNGAVIALDPLEDPLDGALAQVPSLSTFPPPTTTTPPLPPGLDYLDPAILDLLLGNLDTDQTLPFSFPPASFEGSQQWLYPLPAEAGSSGVPSEWALDGMDWSASISCASFNVVLMAELVMQ
ncbi:hypothetical protein RQP46_005193 [Phenoliferia psychrophenolica]